MNDINLYESIIEIENDFPIKIRKYTQAQFFPNWHEHIELLYIINGSGKFFLNSKPINAKSGETIIANSNELHYMTSSSAVDYLCVIINPSIFNDVNCKNIILKSKISEDRFISDIFNDIYNEHISEDSCSDIAIKGKIYILMAYLIRHHAAEQLPQSEYDMRIAKMKTINKILDYIHQNYKIPFSTGILAKELFLSESHLCRIFKSATGFSVIEYLNRYRIEKAAVLLKNTNESISTIAQNTGFDNLNYFDRIFKRYKKVSPNIFRKSTTN